MKAATRTRLGNVLIPAAVTFLCAAAVLFPGDSLNAAKAGLGLWFDNVLPALLPFAVGVGILRETGALRFIGVLLEPVMYPLFRVPGAGGFALISGLMSGYPLGAKVTAELRSDGTLTAEEGQRLSAFSNNSGPLFIIGAVGIGMFGSVTAGYYLYIVHILGALAVGLAFRGLGRDNGVKQDVIKKRLLPRAYKAMTQAKADSGKSLGRILRDSVAGAMESMVLVGGYIMLFCVIVRILEVTGLMALGVRALAPLIGKTLPGGLLTGFLEITNGVKQISTAGATRLALTAAAGLISWGGLSIHAQALGYISKTDVKTTPYLLGKALHAGVSAALATLLYPVFTYFDKGAVSTIGGQPSLAIEKTDILAVLSVSTGYFALALGLTLAAAAVIGVAWSVSRKRSRSG